MPCTRATVVLALLLLLGLIPACTLRHGEIRVLSYNIRHGTDINMKMRLDEQADFVAERKADLISIQEVDDHCSRSGDIDETLIFSKRSDTHPVFQAFMDYDGGRYGIAAFSKLPIRKVEPKFYTAGSEPRNFPLCYLQLGKREVLFVPIHFDWVANNTTRLKQAQELITDVDESGLAVILSGDFNAQPGSETMKLFSDAGFSFTVGKEHTFHGSKGSETSKEIDFIAVRSSDDLLLELLQTHTIEQRELSDHAPVEAQVLWTEL